MESSQQPPSTARVFHRTKSTAGQHHTGQAVAAQKEAQQGLQPSAVPLSSLPGRANAHASKRCEAMQQCLTDGEGLEHLMAIKAHRQHQDPRHNSDVPHSLGLPSPTSTKAPVGSRASAYKLPGIHNAAKHNAQTITTSVKAATLPDLVTSKDIPDDALRELFQEVQELSSHSSVSAALQLTPDKLRTLYAHCSQRLDSLPYALVAHSNEQLRMVALPGPRGVLGYKVNEHGQVLRSPQHMVGPYLAASPHAPQLLKELQDLESDLCANPQGLECEPELVSLWTELGGSPDRHKQVRQPSRQASFARESQTGAKESYFLTSLGILDPQSQHGSPTITPRRGQQRRRSGRLQGRPVVNINTLTGAHLGFYAGYVKSIQELTHPEALGPIIQVMFEQQQAEKERQRLRAQRAMLMSASPDIGDSDGNTEEVAEGCGGGVQGDNRQEDQNLAREASQAAASSVPEQVDWEQWDQETIDSGERGSSTDGLPPVASQPVPQQMTPRSGMESLATPRTFLNASLAGANRHASATASKPTHTLEARPPQSVEGVDATTRPAKCISNAGLASSGRSGHTSQLGSDMHRPGDHPPPDPTAVHSTLSGSGTQPPMALIHLDSLQDEADMEGSQQPFDSDTQQAVDAGKLSASVPADSQHYDPGLMPGHVVPASDAPAVAGAPTGSNITAEAALHLMQSAMLGPGRRTKMRRREPWSVLKQQQQAEQAMAKARTHSIHSHKSRRVTEATDVGSNAPRFRAGNDREQHIGSKSFKSFKSLASRISRVSHSVLEGGDQDMVGLGDMLVCCEEVERLMDEWEMGRDGGDMQVMSVDRLKELMLLETQDVTPRDVVGMAAAELGVQQDPRTWKGQLLKWLPNKEEQQAQARSRGTPAKHVHRQPKPPHLAPTWVPEGLKQRVQMPGSKLKLPEPLAVASNIATAVQAYEQAAQAQLGFGVKVSASAQALHRRLEQQHAHEEQSVRQSNPILAAAQPNISIPLEWGSELDLAMAPHLARADLGLVYQALSNASHITTLRANRGLLDSSGVRGLLHVLQGVHTLQVLDIRDTPAFGAEAAERLGELLQPRHKLMLHTLLLSGCPVNDEGFHSLALGLQFNRTLEHLDLSNCGLTDGALLELDQVLEQNVVLSYLDLSRNRFGAKGIQQLCADLEGNAGLQHLVLSHCRLDDTCAQTLAGLLPCTAALTTLDLSYNSIGPAGAAHLGAALALLNSQACSLGVPSLAHTPSDLHTPTTEQQAKPSIGQPAPKDPTANGPASASATVQTQIAGSTPRAQEAQQHVVGLPPEPHTEASAASSSGPLARPPRPACCPFKNLLLHNNPLSLEGIMHIFKGIQQLGNDAHNCLLSTLGLDNTQLPHKLTTITTAAEDDTSASQQKILGAAVTQLPWDPARPSGTHLLDLATAHGKQVATALVHKACMGHVSWLAAKLDQQLLLSHQLPPASWSSALPSAGVLQVKVTSTSCMAADAVCMGSVLESVVLNQLRSPAASDPVKLQLISCVCHMVAVTAAQAARLISCLDYQGTKVAAATDLLASCVDPHDFIPELLRPQASPVATAHLTTAPQGSCMSSRPGTGSGPDSRPGYGIRPQGTLHSLTGGCDATACSKTEQGLCALVPDEITQMMNTQAVQAWRYTPCADPLLSSIAHWLHLACPGHYALDLSQQVQRMVACCVLAVAGQQQQPHHLIFNHSASSPDCKQHSALGGRQSVIGRYFWQLVVQSWDQPVHLGLLGSMLRNLCYQGQAIGNLPASIRPSLLPRSGLLEFDLVLAHHVRLGPLPSQPNSLPLPPAHSLNIPSKPKPQPTTDTVSASTVLFAGTVHASLASPSAFGSGQGVFGAESGVSYSRFATPPDGIPTSRLAGTSVAAGSAAMLLRASAPALPSRMLQKAASNSRVSSARQALAAQGRAWWQMFSRCLSLMGLDSEDPRLHGCEEAASCWGGPQYDATLVRWRARAIARHCGQIEPDNPDDAGDAGDVAAGGKSAKKGSKKGSSSNKAAKEAAKAAAAAALEMAERQAKATQGARKCLPMMLQHMLTHKLTAVQVLHMLSLLPDVGARVALLMAARPALSDPHHMLDLVVSLAGPTPLPNLQTEQQRLASASSRLGPGAAEPAAASCRPFTGSQSHRPSSTGYDRSTLGPSSPKPHFDSFPASPNGSQSRPPSWFKAGKDNQSGRSFRFQGSFAARGSFRFQGSFAAGRSFQTPTSLSRGRSLRFQDSFASAFGAEGGEFLLDELDRPAEYMRPTCNGATPPFAPGGLCAPCAALDTSPASAPAAAGTKPNVGGGAASAAKPAAATLKAAPRSAVAVPAAISSTSPQPASTGTQGTGTTTSKPVLDIMGLLALALRHLGLGALRLQWADPSTLDLVMQALVQPNKPGSSPDGQQTRSSEDASYAAEEDVPQGPQEGGLLLDMNQAEHVQAAMRLCRWLDMANPATPLDETQPMEGAWTDAGYLPMEQHSSWAQWEQLLGWLCVRCVNPQHGQLDGPPPALDFNMPRQHLVPNRSSLSRPSRSYSRMLTRTLTRRSSSIATVAHAALAAVAAETTVLGKLRLFWSASDAHRAHAAATMIQCVWRGNRLRRCVAAAIQAEVQQGCPCVGKRQRGLDAHLLATHLPIDCLPERAKALLIMAEDSDDASSEPPPEPEVEYVQPLTPLYPPAQKAEVTSRDKASDTGTEPAGPQRYGMQRQSTLQGRLAVAFKSELRASVLRQAGIVISESAGSAVTPQTEVMTQEHKVWSQVVRRWQAAWAMTKYWRCVDKLQRLGGPLALAHARIEMAANADHLFPAACVDHAPVPALAAISEGPA